MTTMNPLRTAILAAVATMMVTVAGSAQTPYYHTFRPSAISMRPAGLADAANADARDVTAMFWNPGSLAFLRYQNIVLTHISDPGTHAKTEQVSAAVFRNAEFSLGVNALVMYGGTLTPEDGPTTEFKGIGGDAALSYLLLPTISVGMIAGVRDMTIGTARKTTGWGLLGVFYYPSPGISYGLTYGAVRGVTYWYSNAQSGVLWEPDLAQYLEIGATMTYPPRAKDPVVTLTLATQRNFPGVSQFSTKGGLEISPVSWMAFRVGFKVGSVERVARYGIGFRYSRARLDLALAPSAVENRFGGIALVIDL